MTEMVSDWKIIRVYTNLTILKDITFKYILVYL